MIDWRNLDTLPLKRQRDPEGRERLARVSHAKRAANHKGRAHFYPWQIRGAEKVAKANAKKAVEIKTGKYRSYIDAVRAYWRGELDEHPTTPQQETGR